MCCYVGRPPALARVEDCIRRIGESITWDRLTLQNRRWRCTNDSEGSKDDRGAHDRSRASGDHLALGTLAYNERLNEGDWGQEHVPSALGAQQTDPGIWDRMKGQRIC